MSKIEDLLQYFVAFNKVANVFVFDDHLFSFETASAAGGIPEMPEGHKPDRVKQPLCFDVKALELWINGLCMCACVNHLRQGEGGGREAWSITSLYVGISHLWAYTGH